MKKLFSSIFLNDKRVATITAVMAALAVLIWGAQFGLLTWPARLMIVVTIFLILVIYLLVRNFIAARTSKVFEKLIVSDADKLRRDASPDQREDMNVLNSRLQEALETLKSSKMGKVGGKNAALYDLPWYLVIGHPAAGKSSAVVNSGLNFPFSDGDNTAVHGVGGTRHCDWFFSPEGVLVDSAGRYSIQNEDRSAWLSFLHLLKKHRPRAPINGVLLVVSTYDLMTLPESKAELLAKKMRERLQELTDTLSLSLPVYVLFNKVDLVEGFNDFYRHFDDKDIEQVWGSTIPHEEYFKSLDAKGIFSMRFDELYGSLKEKRRDFLSKKFSNKLEKGTFSFPIEFLKLKNPLEKFVDIVFSENPYQNEPLFRGFYFTSAVREGRPQAFEAKRLISKYDLGDKGGSSSSSKHSSGIFLKELFRDVIFADRNLIGLYSENKNLAARLVSFFSGFALLAGVVGLFTWTFLNNQKLIDTVGIEVAEMQAVPTDDFKASLEGLNKLRTRIEQLDEYNEEGAPLNLSLGLYKGQDANEIARKEFFDRFHTIFLVPLKGSLEKQLDNIEGGLAQDRLATNDEQPKTKKRTPIELNYNALKTYLMLGERKRQEYSYLLAELPVYWREYVKEEGKDSDGEIEELSASLLNYYASQAGKPDISIIENDELAVTKSREALQAAFSARSPIEQVYASIRSEANARFPALSVNAILVGQFTDVVVGSNVVPGAFTKKAYQGFVLGEIAKAASKDTDGNDWVLGGDYKRSIEGSEKVISDKLLSLYHDDYKNAWLHFMNGLNIKYMTSLQSAGQSIDRITSINDSPVQTLAKTIYFETALPSKIDIQNKLGETKQKLLGKVKRTLGGEVVEDPSTEAKNMNPVTAYFKPLHQAIGQGSSNDSLVKTYLLKLSAISRKLKALTGNNDPQVVVMVQSVLDQKGSVLADGLNFVDDDLLAGLDPELRRALRPFFMNPIANVFDLLLPPTADQINKDWQENIMPRWRSLSKKKPFSNSIQKASQSEITSLFGASGAIQNFYVKHKPLLTEKWGSKGLEVSASARDLMSMKRRFEIRDTVEYDRSAQKLALRNYNRSYKKEMAAYNRAVKKAKSQSRAPVSFSVMPHPTAGVRSIKLVTGGNTLLYRNGPQFWREFNWNGGSIKISATPVSTGVEKSVTVIRGTSAFRRALRAGSISAQIGENRIRFSLKSHGSVKASVRLPKKPVYRPPNVKASSRKRTQIYKVNMPNDVVSASIGSGLPIIQETKTSTVVQADSTVDAQENKEEELQQVVDEEIKEEDASEEELEESSEEIDVEVDDDLEEGEPDDESADEVLDEADMDDVELDDEAA